MTSKTFEDLGGNGSIESKGDALAELPGFPSLVAMVVSRGLNHKGELALDGKSLDLLRDSKEREQLLNDFMIGMIPDWVNPELWFEWLNGVSIPFEGKKLRRVEAGSGGSGKEIKRQRDRLPNCEGDVRRRRAAVEAAKAKLEAAENALKASEQKLVEMRAFDKALIQYVVSEHLLGVMAPMFAMGPAWTVMRAVSSHVGHEVIEEELGLITDPKRREDKLKILRAERKEQSAKLFGLLDLWAGDYGFEIGLRDSILQFVERYEGIERPGKHLRSSRAMKAGVIDPEVVEERDEIVSGMACGEEFDPWSW